MTGLWIGLGLLAILIALIPVLPIGLMVIYGKDGFRVFALVGFIKIPLDFDKKEEKAEKKSDKDPKLKSDLKKLSSRAKSAITEKDGGKLSEFLPLLDAVLKLLGDLRKKITVKSMELNLILGGDDACNLALNYGRAWAAVGNIIPLLEQVFRIKKRNIQVNCDFTALSTKIYTRLRITITLWRLVSLLTKYGMPVYREYQKIINNNEGGAEL